jgi:hypothetical protein
MMRSALPLRAAIPPNVRAVVTAKLRTGFRPERLTISPESFPVPALRRAWTWPLVKVGRALGRGHRALAKVMCVDLYADHERRVPVGDDEPDGDDIHKDGDGNRYRVVDVPLNRRERILAPIYHLSRRLSDVRLRWQLNHVAMLAIHQITIESVPQMAEDGTLPADLFASPVIDQFVTFDSCVKDKEITVEISNGSGRTCHLKAALIGSAVGDAR